MRKTVTIGPWANGLNNVKPLEELSNKEVSDADNFWFDERGDAQTRPGYEQRVSGVDCSGLVALDESRALYFDQGDLILLDTTDWSTKSLSSGFPGTGYRWARIDDRLFFSNGKRHGRVFLDTLEVIQGFGCPDVTQKVTLSELGYGSLPEGRYFVGITWVNWLGEESGCRGVQMIEASKGILVQLEGTPPSEVASIRVYLSGANGTRREMYRVVELDATDTSFDITDMTFGSPLETLYLEAVPAPDLFCTYNGHLFFSKSNMVWASETMNYGLYDMDHGEVGYFPVRVTVLEPCVDGLFISADKTYAYTGPGPKDLRRVVVSDARGVFGSGCQVDGSLFPEAPAIPLPFWFSNRGAYLGLPEGQVVPLTKGKTEPDVFQEGASGVIEYGGISGVVTSVNNRTADGDSVRMQDNFSVTVIDRGISDA